MNVRQYYISFFTAIALLLGVLLPISSFAATCTCYYGPYNNCAEVYISKDAQELACDTACRKAFGTAVRSTDHDSEDDPDVVADCVVANAAANAEAENERAE